jgi:hypothetical protein
MNMAENAAVLILIKRLKAARSKRISVKVLLNGNRAMVIGVNSNDANTNRNFPYLSAAKLKTMVNRIMTMS